MGRRVNKGDLAAVFGVSLTTIGGWVRRGCPFLVAGSKTVPWEFDTAAVARWREQQAAIAAQGDTSDLDIDEAKRRKLAAEAALAEIDLARARGEVVEIEQVAEVIGEQFSALRARLMAMPSKVAPLVIGVGDLGEVREVIDDHVRDALAELSGFGDADGGDPEDDADGGDLEPAEAEA